MSKHYHPDVIEQDIQQYWEKNQIFAVKEDINKEKFYCLTMLPYPSGELHMGHVRNYTIGDVIARYQRMLGKNVLQPMGWDAFGLPAENAALKHGSAPSKWTYQNIDIMRQQLKRLGFAFDWRREITTCKPDYYRWEQWLFVRMYKKGLAYQKKTMVNWDPVDCTVLANEQVVDGRGWRSGALVERREITQWFLKITAYAEELLQGLDALEGWPEQVRTMQRNWIGRSEGVELDFAVAGLDNTKIRVFTTRPDTLMGTSYLALAPNHPLTEQAAQTHPQIADFIQRCRNIKVAEAQISTMEREGFATGFFALHPITGQKLPIWTANYVLMEYGSGAVMAVPAHDTRDFEFAKRYQLPIKPVITPRDTQAWPYPEKAFTESGILMNSGEFSGLSSVEACHAIADYLERHGQGQRKIHYRLRDWGVSRQRYWGTPIPIIYCQRCGIVPVPETDLPVVLPENIQLKNPSSPLVNMPEFYETECPQCQQPARRETDTFDTFMESSWYYARYCCPDQHKAMLDNRTCYWTPVDQYVGGIEHAVMHLLYARFIHKVLRDEGLVNSSEPFTRLLTQGMVLKDGAKMSKSKGNTVSPTELIGQFGADTVRLFSMFAAPPEQSLEWSDSGVEGCYRFLKKLWQKTHEVAPILNSPKTSFDWNQAGDEEQKLRRELYGILNQATHDMERQQYNTVVSAGMKLLNLLSKLVLEQPAQRALAQEGFNILLRLLTPIVPHICQSLWQTLGLSTQISDARWPKVEMKALKTSSLTLVVQVNGKLRGQIEVPSDADNPTIEALVRQDQQIQRHLADKAIRKVIVVPKRLVNIVV